MTEPMPVMPPSNGFEADARGFFASLLDWKFESFVTVKIIKVLYILIFAFSILAWIFFTITGFASSATLGAIILLIVGPIFVLLNLTFYRVLLEFYVVVFRIGADVQAIRSRA